MTRMATGTDGLKALQAIKGSQYVKNIHPSYSPAVVFRNFAMCNSVTIDPRASCQIS